ncbi:MAG: hypothetical protein IV107_16940, partial [Paucibacter sp.]|nr:hypothetical protein [Roseateles sp.]
GEGCTIYQGVTLGGTALVKGAKRHPTLEAGVIVGANACVLGGFTVGAGARIGSGAVVTKPVPAGATAVGNPARIIEAKTSAKPVDPAAGLLGLRRQPRRRPGGAGDARPDRQRGRPRPSNRLALAGGLQAVGGDQLQGRRLRAPRRPAGRGL